MTSPDGRMLGYSMDANGNRTSLTATIGSTVLTTTFALDQRNQISTVTDPDGRVYNYTYNGNGSPVSLAQPNGVTTTYTMDSLNRLTLLTSKHGATTLASYLYTLGVTGLRNQVAETDGTTRAYQYDSLYRLTTETVTGSVADYSKTFVYDSVGNRTQQVTTGAGAATIDATFDNRDRLLTDGASTLAWDFNGNLISRSGGDTYQWDFDDRLKTVTKSDGTVVDHVYDVDGNRVKTTVTPPSAAAVVTNFLVDTAEPLSQVVAETNGSGAVQAYYVRCHGQLLAVRRGSMDAGYYLTDGLGSVRNIADGSGSTTDSKTYTAFGETISHTGSDPQPYGFAGQASDPTSGLSYNRARWMDPRTGTFLAMDPEYGWTERPITMHRYGYGGADPVNHLDPSGRDWTIVAAMVVTGIGAYLANESFANAGQKATAVKKGLYPWPSPTRKLSSGDLEALDRLVKSADAAWNLFFGSHLKKDEIDLVAAGTHTVSVAESLMGFPIPYSLSHVFDVNFGGAGFADVPSHVAHIGTRAFVDETAVGFMALMGHETGHLWQAYRYGWTTNADYQKDPAKFQNEADDVMVQYLIKLGIPQGTAEAQKNHVKD